MRMLYQAYQAQRDLSAPAVALASFTSGAIDLLPAPLRDLPSVRWLSATSRLASRARLIHERPPFGIETVDSGGGGVPVCERVVDATTFGTLIHFDKPGADRQPRVLVVAARRRAAILPVIQGATRRSLSPTVKMTAG